MLRRSISCMLAGLLGMGGLILLVILFLPGARPTPFFFFAGAGFIAAVGLIWLASEIAEGFRTGSTRQDRMAFTSAQSAAIKGLNVEDVRRRLAYAGPGRTAVVPGLGDGMIPRGDVEDWLAEQGKNAAKAQRRRDILQGVAIGVSVGGIIVGVIVTYLFSALSTSVE